LKELWLYYQSDTKPSPAQLPARRAAEELARARAIFVLARAAFVRRCRATR